MTFEKIEDLLENHALFELMSENKEEDLLDLEAAKKYLEKLRQEPLEFRPLDEFLKEYSPDE